MCLSKREKACFLVFLCFAGNRPLVFGLSLAFFAAGTSLLGALLSVTGDPRPLALLAFSIACGYVYQGPPFRRVADCGAVRESALGTGAMVSQGQSCIASWFSEGLAHSHAGAG